MPFEISQPERLAAMYPSVPPETIARILESSGNDVHKCLEMLDELQFSNSAQTTATRVAALSPVTPQTVSGPTRLTPSQPVATTGSGAFPSNRRSPLRGFPMSPTSPSQPPTATSMIPQSPSGEMPRRGSATRQASPGAARTMSSSVREFVSQSPALQRMPSGAQGTQYPASNASFSRLPSSQDFRSASLAFEGNSPMKRSGSGMSGTGSFLGGRSPSRPDRSPSPTSSSTQSQFPPATTIQSTSTGVRYPSPRYPSPSSPEFPGPNEAAPSRRFDFSEQQRRQRGSPSRSKPAPTSPARPADAAATPISSPPAAAPTAPTGASPQARTLGRSQSPAPEVPHARSPSEAQPLSPSRSPPPRQSTHLLGPLPSPPPAARDHGAAPDRDRHLSPAATRSHSSTFGPPDASSSPHPPLNRPPAPQPSASEDVGPLATPHVGTAVGSAASPSASASPGPSVVTSPASTTASSVSAPSNFVARPKHSSASATVTAAAPIATVSSPSSSSAVPSAGTVSVTSGATSGSSALPQQRRTMTTSRPSPQGRATSLIPQPAATAATPPVKPVSAAASAASRLAVGRSNTPTPALSRRAADIPVRATAKQPVDPKHTSHSPAQLRAAAKAEAKTRAPISAVLRKPERPLSQGPPSPQRRTSVTGRVPKEPSGARESPPDGQRRSSSSQERSPRVEPSHHPAKGSRRPSGGSTGTELSPTTSPRAGAEPSQPTHTNANSSPSPRPVATSNGTPRSLLFERVMAICETMKKEPPPAAAPRTDPVAFGTDGLTALGRPLREIGIKQGARTLDIRLSGLRLKQHEMRDDGNCLFRSVAHQLWDDPEKHALVREQCVRQLREARDNYAIYFDDGTYDEFVDNMGQDGFWGDEFALKAIVDSFGCVMYVMVSTEGTWYHRYAPCEFTDQQIAEAPKVFLSYLSPIHYNSLTYVTGEKIHLPPQDVLELPELSTAPRPPLRQNTMP